MSKFDFVSLIPIIAIGIVVFVFFAIPVQQQTAMQGAYSRDQGRYDDYLSKIPAASAGAKASCENDFNGVFRASDVGQEHPMRIYNDPVPFGAWCKINREGFLHEYLMEKYKGEWQLTTKENNP